MFVPILQSTTPPSLWAHSFNSCSNLLDDTLFALLRNIFSVLSSDNAAVMEMTRKMHSKPSKTHCVLENKSFFLKKKNTTQDFSQYDSAIKHMICIQSSFNRKNSCILN